MAKSIWRRNDFIYFDNRNNGLSSGNIPTPPTPSIPSHACFVSQAVTTSYDCTCLRFHIGIYSHKIMMEGTANAAPLYVSTGVGQPVAPTWFDVIDFSTLGPSYAADRMASAYWAKNQGGFFSTYYFMIFVPNSSSNNNVYHIYVNGQAITYLISGYQTLQTYATLPNGNQGSTTFYQIPVSAAGGVNDMVAALNNSQLFTTRGRVLLFDNGAPNTMTRSNDDILKAVKAITGNSGLTQVVDIQ